MKEIKLFPYVLGRISGDDFDRFSEFLQTPGLDRCMALWQEGSQQKEDAKINLCEGLKKYIETLTNPREQNDLQNFRRNVFNDRLIRDTDWLRVTQAVPAALADALTAYRTQTEQVDALLKDTLHAYDQAMRTGREQIKALVSRESFQKGLLLASNSLYQQLDKYQNTPETDLGKRALQVEGSILQYLSRIFTKTSPLSTFTNLTLGTFHDDPNGEPITFTGKAGRRESVSSHLRLNNSLFHYLKSVLSVYPPAMQNLPVTLNPTIARRDASYQFLINSHNIESFQQLRANGVIDQIIALLQQHAYTFGALRNAMIDLVQATDTELTQYMQQLVRYGLLELDFGISGIDPLWDTKLIALLCSWPHDPAGCFQDLRHVLEQLQLLKTRYATAPVHVRRELLDQGYDAFKTMYVRVHEAAGLPAEERDAMRMGLENPQIDHTSFQSAQSSFAQIQSTFFSLKRENIFYEDTVRNVDFNMNHEDVLLCINKINMLMQSATVFRFRENEKDKMTTFFNDKYGTKATVPVLEFYKDYYADMKKPSLQERALADAGQADTSIVPERHARAYAAANRLADSMRAQKGLPEITIDSRLLTDALPPGILETPKPANAHGGFFQFYRDQADGKFKVVVNRTFPGYGKMLSRFLHLFDDTVTDAIRTWNAALAAPDEVFIENCDASFYNANIHPSLLPYEIRLPGSHNSLPPASQLDVSQFHVVSDPSDSISIYHTPSGRRAYFFDLAFQASAGRSNLFQLLQTFSRAEYLHVNPICFTVTDATRTRQPDANEIQVLPRIVYDDTVIIQRKSWVIPRSRLPLKNKAETDAAYYLRVNAWRIAQAIPDEVFLIIQQRSGAAKHPGKGRDDYKPQYMNLRNPFFIRMLAKLLDKVTTVLLVQEMLPTSAQLVRIDGLRHVSEFVVQWYEQ